LQNRRFGQWAVVYGAGAEPVQVDVEVSVGEGALVLTRKTDAEAAAERG
jgi:hypothetical protein